MVPPPSYQLFHAAIILQGLWCHRVRVNELDSWGRKGRIVESTMGTALPLCSYKFDCSQIVVVPCAQWVLVVGGANPYNQHVDP